MRRVLWLHNAQEQGGAGTQREQGRGEGGSSVPGDSEHMFEAFLFIYVAVFTGDAPNVKL